MTDKQSLLPALWGVSKKLLLLVPEVWVLFVTQLIHPGLTETVCTYLIPKYSGLGAGRWLPGRGWGLRSPPPQLRQEALAHCGDPGEGQSESRCWGVAYRGHTAPQRALRVQKFAHFPCPFSSSSSVQLLSCVCLFATPWTAARQASLSITNSRSLFKLMSIESVMPSNPSHPLSSPSPPAFNLAQYQGLF